MNLDKPGCAKSAWEVLALMPGTSIGLLMSGTLIGLGRPGLKP